MPRRPFTLAAVVSLVMCVAIAVTWVRSAHHAAGGEELLRWHWDGARHVVRADADRLTVSALPRPTGDTAARQAAAEAVARLSDRELVWAIDVRHGTAYDAHFPAFRTASRAWGPIFTWSSTKRTLW